MRKIIIFHPFLLLAPDVSAGRTASERWWTSQELSSAGIITIMASTLTFTRGMNKRPVMAPVLRRQSLSITINQKIPSPTLFSLEAIESTY
jgi:hypothetical protein